MTLNDTLGTGCSGLPAGSRCEASLPDNPQCAPNYHFGMLLGVEDFRAEQGFHVGRLRRHQRLLHGAGVVAGYAVDFDATTFELRVGPGYGIDLLGRDLMLEVTQCVSLPLWWEKHAKDEAFDDIANPKDATFDLDVVVCYATCLDRPVPAIAEPCAGDAADIAHSRLCETVTLALVRHKAKDTVPGAASRYHLLRMWLGLEGPATDAEGKPRADDQWLIDQFAALQALPATEQDAARRALLRELLARAVAATSSLPPDELTNLGVDESGRCLTLARLHDVHLVDDVHGKRASVGNIELGARTALLPGDLLQALLLADPPAVPAAAGPVVKPSGATLTGQDVTLVFSQPLAAASVSSAAFAVSEFVAAAGWKLFSLNATTYDESDPTAPAVTLTLNRAPTGSRLRITVIGSGSTPLLGSKLIPAAALHPDSDGRNLTTTLTI